MARTRIIVVTRSVVVVAAVVGLAMVLGGCEGGQKQEAVSAPVGIDDAASATPTATASPTASATASPTPAVTASPSPVAAIAAALKRDPAAAPDATAEKITISSIDPTWAFAATFSPSAGGARALLHQTGDTWKVVSSGSSEVGCGNGVPAAVMTEFGLGCPS